MKFIKRFLLVVVIVSAVTGISATAILSYVKSHSIDLAVKFMDEHPEYQQMLGEALDVQAENIRDLTVNLPEEDKAAVKDIINRNIDKVTDAVTDDELQQAIKDKDTDALKDYAKDMFSTDDLDTLKDIYKNQIDKIKNK